MNNAVIVVEDLEKKYGETGQPVLRGVSLTISAGEFVCLMGSSGSGKTTLLNLIGGLDKPDAGRIVVEGMDLGSLEDDARSAFRLRRMGFVFQFFNLLPNLSVAENIALPLLFLGEKERTAKARAGELAEEVGLADKLKRQAHQLSGGEMQRVGIARALIHRPAVLLADEPTGNLDSRTGATILALLQTASRQHGATLLMATHDHGAATLADRVVHMVDGQIIEDGN